MKKVKDRDTEAGPVIISSKAKGKGIEQITSH